MYERAPFLGPPVGPRLAKAPSTYSAPSSVILSEWIEPEDLYRLHDLGEGKEDAKGVAQQSTREGNALRRPFEAWLGPHRYTARIRLIPRPDGLERPGVLVRSEN